MYWEVWLQQCPLEDRLDVVIICVNPNELVIDRGFHSQVWWQKFNVLGYLPRFWYLQTTKQWGVVWQDQLVLLLQKETSNCPFLEQGPLPMQMDTIHLAMNMMKTYLIPPMAWN